MQETFHMDAVYGLGTIFLCASKSTGIMRYDYTDIANPIDRPGTFRVLGLSCGKITCISLKDINGGDAHVLQFDPSASTFVNTQMISTGMTPNAQVDLFMSKEVDLFFLAHSNRIAVYKQSDLSTELSSIPSTLSSTYDLQCNGEEYSCTLLSALHNTLSVSYHILASSYSNNPIWSTNLSPPTSEDYFKEIVFMGTGGLFAMSYGQTTKLLFYDKSGTTNCHLSCATCNGPSANECLTCSVGRYLYTNNNTCTSTCPPTSKTNGALCEPWTCHTTCATCTGTLPTNCFTCPSTTYLFPSTKTCGPCNAPGQFIKTSDSTCRSCDSSCATCTSWQPNACTSCSSPLSLFPDSTCDNCSNFDGMYPFTSSGIARCGRCDSTCSKCVDSTDQCIACAYNDRFATVNTTGPAICYPSVRTNITVSLPSVSTQPLLFTLTPDALLKPSQITALAQTLPVQISVIDTMTTSVIATTTYTMTQQSNYIQLAVTVTYTQSSNNSRIKVKMSNKWQILDTFSTSVVVVNEFFSTFLLPSTDTPPTLVTPLPPYDPSNSSSLANNTNLTQEYIADRAQITQAGAVVTALTSLNPTKSNTVTDMIGLLSNLDPSGTLTRFFQIMKIISRLTYFNLNYGSRLGLFLSASESMSGIPKQPADLLAHQTNSFRSRLGTFNVSLDLPQCFYTWKVLAYTLSWLLTQSLSYVTSTRAQVRPIFLYLLYYWPKVHSALLSVLIVDYAFICPRFTLHSLDPVDRLYALTVLIMLSIDQLTLLHTLMDNHLWYNIVKRVRSDNKNNNRPVDNSGLEGNGKVRTVKCIRAASKSINDVGNASRTILINDASKAKVLSSASTLVGIRIKHIDYDKTYLQICLGAPIFDTASRNLSFNSSVNTNLFCRLGFIFHNIRLVILHMMMVLSQSLPIPCIFITALTEIARVILVSVLYIKYKLFNNTLTFVLEVNQSLLMSIFLILILASQPNPSDGMQSNGIYLVIVICATEYVLNIVYVISSLVDLVKTTLCKGKSPTKQKGIHPFIRYKYASTSSAIDRSPRGLAKSSPRSTHAPLRRVSNQPDNMTNPFKMKLSLSRLPISPLSPGRVHPLSTEHTIGGSSSVSRHGKSYSFHRDNIINKYINNH